MRTGYKITAGNASVITVFFTQHTEFVRADYLGFFGTGKTEDEALQSLLRSIQGSGVKIWQRDVMLKGDVLRDDMQPIPRTPPAAEKQPDPGLVETVAKTLQEFMGLGG